MPDEKQTTHPQRRTRTIVRTITIGGKFTPTEFDALSKIASDSGQLLSEWARDVLLRQTQAEESNLHLISEVVGLQLLLMNTLAPIARGEKISAEQFQAIVKSVQSTKVKAAEEMLSRRRQPREA